MRRQFFSKSLAPSDSIFGAIAYAMIFILFCLNLLFLLQSFVQHGSILGKLWWGTFTILYAHWLYNDNPGRRATTAMTQLNCPGCGHPIAELSSTKKRPPHTGDVGMCTGCLCIAIYYVRDQTIMLAKATAEQRAQLLRDADFRSFFALQYNKFNKRREAEEKKQRRKGPKVG